MSILRSGLIISVFTFLSRISGFARDIFISSHLGASIASDIFNVAFRLPNFFRRIFAEGAFSSAFIPIYNDKIGNSEKEFKNSVFTILSLILIIFVIIIELIIPALMYILAPGFEKNSTEWSTAIELCTISMPYLFFISLVSFFSAILNSHKKYGYAAFNPIILNIVMIFSLLYLKNYLGSALRALVWGIAIAGFIQLLAMIYAAKENNLMPRLIKPKFSKDVNKLLKNMVPGIIGGGVMQINILIDQAIASFLAAGSISYLAYADRVNQLPLAIIGTAIGTIILPVLSREVKLGNLEKIYAIQNKSISIALLIVIPASFALYYLSENIIISLFMRGEFTINDALCTARALAIFSFGLPAYVLVKIFAPCFFANFDTKTPLKLSIICLLANLVISLCLVSSLSYVAIAIATVCSAWINCVLMWFNLKKKNLIKFDSQLKIKAAKIFLASLFMLISIYLFNSLLAISMSNSINLLLISKIIVGIISYILGIFMTKTFTINEIREVLRK